MSKGEEETGSQDASQRVLEGACNILEAFSAEIPFKTTEKAESEDQYEMKKSIVVETSKSWGSAGHVQFLSDLSSIKGMLCSSDNDDGFA